MEDADCMDTFENIAYPGYREMIAPFIIPLNAVFMTEASAEGVLTIIFLFIIGGIPFEEDEKLLCAKCAEEHVRDDWFPHCIYSTSLLLVIRTCTINVSVYIFCLSFGTSFAHLKPHLFCSVYG